MLVLVDTVTWMAHGPSFTLNIIQQCLSKIILTHDAEGNYRLLEKKSCSRKYAFLLKWDVGPERLTIQIIQNGSSQEWPGTLHTAAVHITNRENKWYIFNCRKQEVEVYLQ